MEILYSLLEKEDKFVFDDKCQKAFNKLKERLTSAPVIVTPDWSLPFKLMCDARGFAIGTLLNQRHNKIMHPIYYASRTLNAALRDELHGDCERAACYSVPVEELDIYDAFPDEQVLALSMQVAPRYADLANYLVAGIIPEKLKSYQKKKFLCDSHKYYWDEPYLFRTCANNIIRRCVPESEILEILKA
ncbi:uncharacterized protein LOC132066491 [Lycium ferocissimum]|uniref:uncharacterized protein LOC132066491 n=1 Tax=Lycium ferocissimum TaxID=112874 RepID=UPI002814D35F|nr:uncharacterized protein LOC132066491 [Lycium ferocissimum]